MTTQTRPEALQPSFTDANIEVVKEEGNTLQVNQAYDQLVAKQGHEVDWLVLILAGALFYGTVTFQKILVSKYTAVGLISNYLSY